MIHGGCRCGAVRYELAEARRILSDSQPAATLDAARIRLDRAITPANTLRARLDVALSPEVFCVGCGLGAPGVVQHYYEGAKPCPECAR